MDIKKVFNFIVSLERKEILSLVSFFILLFIFALSYAGFAIGVCWSQSVDVRLYWYVNNVNSYKENITLNSYYMVRHNDNLTKDVMLVKRIVCFPHTNITVSNDYFVDLHTITCENNDYKYSFLTSNKINKYDLHALRGKFNTGDNYFVLGDNSYDSYDSRYREFGFVNKTEIMYKVHKIF